MENPLENLLNQPMALLGLGVENQALGRFFIKRGIYFSVCDAGPQNKLATQRQAWAPWVSQWQLGPDYLDKLDTFALAWRTPGLPARSPDLIRARNSGVQISSQTQLFLHLCPAPIVGVTGTKGKGTTTSLLGAMLASGPYRRVWIGGNIGTPPIDFIDQIQSNDLVLLELSSFQLQDLNTSPPIALVLSVTQDHLDYHADRQEYVEAKTSISRHQKAEDLFIYNRDCPTASTFPGGGRRLAFSLSESVEAGVYLEAGQLWWRPPSGRPQPICSAATALPGRHNLENAAAAAATAAALGAPLDQIAAAITHFEPLPHRLERVGEKNGITYYNDSLATTPDAAIAALQTFDNPIVLIAGGSSKGADFSQLGRQLNASQIRALILMGPEGPQIAQAARAGGNFAQDSIIYCADLNAAMDTAWSRAQAGDIVLLSPACASFGLFANYAQRGEAFRQLVQNHQRAET